MVVDNELFLRFRDGVLPNSLDYILQAHNDPHSQHTGRSLCSSSYYNNTDFITLAKHNATHFSILSTNIQSIHANFSELEAYVHELDQINFKFRIICLQESWLKDNADMSQLLSADFNYIAQGKRCSSKSG